jgi:hypothetical protein
MFDLLIKDPPYRVPGDADTHSSPLNSVDDLFRSLSAKYLTLLFEKVILFNNIHDQNKGIR